ncbi:hypothetical protein LUZ60_005745 [Juncus effusus]|nr:hypothetical protein LUZ60_005745 [Juncus effusus]
MADRVPPGTELAAFGSPVISAPEPAIEPDPEQDSHQNQHPWLPPPPRETYIVQVPKEQIYRVPPPENAALVERYRNQVETRTRRAPPLLKCLAWFFFVLLLIVLLCAVIAVVFFVTVRPASPKFKVDKVYVTKSSTPEYDFTLSTENPSGAMEFQFEKGGEATLTNRGVRIATGKTNGLDLDSKNMTAMKIALMGLKIVVPKEVGKALKGGKDSISLNLQLQIRVSGKAWGMQKGGMAMAVSCDITLKGLVKQAGIKSQKCKTDFRWM